MREDYELPLMNQGIDVRREVDWVRRGKGLPFWRGTPKVLEGKNKF